MINRRPLYVLSLFVIVMIVFLLASRMNLNNSSDANTTSTTTSTTIAPTDWQVGVARVTALENELFSNPDPSRVQEIMTTDCTCYNSTTQRLTTLKEQGRHVDGDNLKVDSVTLHQQISPDEVRAFVVISDNGRPIVDSQDKVIETSPKADRAGLLYLMIKGTDNQWRIADRVAASTAEVGTNQ